MKWYYDWPSYFLTAFSSLLCVSRLLQVRIHSTPGVNGAQPFRLAATGFLFSALPLVCYSLPALPEDRRIYTAFIQTNSVCCLLPTRWESIWLGPAGCVFIGLAPRPFEEKDWPMSPGGSLICSVPDPPLLSLSELCGALRVSLDDGINGCFSIDECWR